MYSGESAFTEAARKGHLNILKFLLTKGASVDQKNDDGKIQILPNYLFIYPTIFLEFLKCLLTKGSLVDEKDRWGNIQLLPIYLIIYL